MIKYTQLEALKLAEAWISGAPHGDNCYLSAHYEGDPGGRCNCFKEEVLSTLQNVIDTAEQP